MTAFDTAQMGVWGVQHVSQLSLLSAKAVHNVVCCLCTSLLSQTEKTVANILLCLISSERLIFVFGEIFNLHWLCV